MCIMEQTSSLPLGQSLGDAENTHKASLHAPVNVNLYTQNLSLSKLLLVSWEICRWEQDQASWLNHHSSVFWLYL